MMKKISITLATIALVSSGWAKPNVVLIMADDFGVGSINAYGAPKELVRTPNLNRLADGGMRFTNARYDNMLYNRVTPELQAKVRSLNTIAESRGQSLAQMTLCWNLSFAPVASVLIGASRSEQIMENVEALEKLSLSAEEHKKITDVLMSEGLDEAQSLVRINR
jgi:L-glyceraldehyde 3-phosphate reductase